MTIEPNTTTTNWKTIVLCLVAGHIAIMHLGKVAPALPQIQSDFGISFVFGGWIASIFNLTGISLGLIAGTLSDRMGHRNIILSGLLVLAAGSFIGALTQGGLGLLLSRLVEGVGFTAIVVSAAALTIQSSSLEHRKLALMIWGTYFPVGLFIFFWISGWILEIQGWRFLWIIGGSACLIWALVFALGTTVTSQNSRSGPPLRGFIKNITLTLMAPGTLVIAVCFAFYSLQQLALLTWLPSFLAYEHDIEPGQAGFLVASTQIFNFAGNVLCWWVLSRGVLIWKTIFICGWIMIVTVLTLFWGGASEPVQLILVYALALFGGLIPIAVFTSVPLLSPSPSQLATLNGLVVMFSALGQIAGPPLLALTLGPNQVWDNSFWLLVLCSLLITILAWLMRPIEKRIVGSGHH